MKSLILLSLTTVLMCSTAIAQNKIDPPKEKEGIMINSTPLIVLDGKIAANFKLNELSPDSIKSISVLKDAASTAKYGPEGANGVLVITTKNADSKLLMENKIILRGNNTYGKNPLYVLDDKIMGEASINEIDPNKVQSITILKDASAIALYGKMGENGVMLIETKKETSPQIKK